MTHLTGPARAQYVQSMFARVAGKYDLMNRLMTGGQDLRWRKMVIALAALPSGGALLDLGTGTGDIAAGALAATHAKRDRRASGVGRAIPRAQTRRARRVPRHHPAAAKPAAPVHQPSPARHHPCAGPPHRRPVRLRRLHLPPRLHRKLPSRRSPGPTHGRRRIRKCAIQAPHVWNHGPALGNQIAAALSVIAFGLQWAPRGGLPCNDQTIDCRHHRRLRRHLRHPRAANAQSGGR
ncbi:MAG: class I SAM-dependent methyltransferase [Chloroflexi bacterium]|nr:class I SAM-dependent methyltransferase [Chloroflexota bacterium]